MSSKRAESKEADDTGASTPAAAAAAAAAKRAATSWTRAQVLAVVDGVLKTEGKDPEAMSVSFDAFNSSWSQYIAALQRSTGASEAAGDSMRALVAKLEGHDFWAVYSAPMTPGLGGDVWTFVDRDTREVIVTIRGQ